MDNYWPKKEEDCRISFNSGDLNSCDLAYDGGAENVNLMCTSLFDSSYDMDIVITEIDTTSANDVSSLHIPYDNVPTFADNRITRYTMKKFIQEDPSKEVKDHKDDCVAVELSVAFGIGLLGPLATVGGHAGIKYEDCSTWKEVPGGYTVHMSVYNHDDPSYDLAYSLTPSW